MGKLLAMFAVLLMLGACSDAPAEHTSSSDELNRALCNDLDDGMTVMNVKPADMSPEDFAERLYLATEHECPEHLDTPGVRTLLENWGYTE